MKTNELSDLLAANLEKVDHRFVARIVLTAVSAALVLACAVAVFALGARPEVTRGVFLPYVAGKVGFALSLTVLTTICLLKYCRPGSASKSGLAWIAMPFAALLALAMVSLVNAPSTHWPQMIHGGRWLECLVSIPLLAVVPFGIVIVAVRQTAPTDLTRAGLLAGLVAGGLSAIGYSLHCADDSWPFIATWYGGTIAICGLAGARLGPRLLRW